jgi:hypothetical protein
VRALRRILGLKAEKTEKDAPVRTLELTTLSTIKPLRVHWLWDQRIPSGMLALLAGREGLGKSTIAYERAARVTRGQLDGELRDTPRNVIVTASEDSFEHTIVPRLIAAGADLDRVFRATVKVQELGSMEISLPDDIPGLEAAIREREVALVVLDPIISRLGRKLDTHKDADVRLALEPIVALADRTKATFLGVIHVNKTSTADPLNSVMGSRAFSATARAVLFVVRDGDTRLLCFPKSNLGPEQKSEGFRIQGKTVATDETGKPITTAEVVWTGTSDRTAREVLEELVSGNKRTMRDRAEAWLLERLKNGAAPSADVKGEAKLAGIPERTLKRAAKDLGVVSASSGFPARTTWALPKEDM